MKNKKTPKESKKRRDIIKSAGGLFMNYGVKKVTVEEICGKAKASKMTFYKYFPNKIALFQQVWESWIDEGCQKLDEIDALNIPLPDKIKRMFDWKTDFLSKIGTAMVDDLSLLNLDYRNVIARFMEFIINAQKRGEIRPDIKPEFLMTVLDKLYELGNDERLRSMYPSLIEFNREVKDFFWYGIITRDDDRSEFKGEAGSSPDTSGSE